MGGKANGPVLSYKVSQTAVAYLSQSNAATVSGPGSVAASGTVPTAYSVKYCQCHGKPVGIATQVRVGNPFRGDVVPLEIGLTHRYCLECRTWVLLKGYYHLMPPQTKLPPGKQAYGGKFISGTATVGATHCANPSNGKV